MKGIEMNFKLFTFFIILFLFSCNSEDVVKPIDENPLLGKWSESFSWTDLFNCVTPSEGETYCPPISETSTIEFTENNFEVKVLPPSRTYIVEDDTIYVGLAGDTLFTGNYSISNDTIQFYRNDSENPIKVKYWVSNDSLYLSTLSEAIMVVMDGDTSYLAGFSMCSFLWGNAWGKTYGTFNRFE